MLKVMRIRYVCLKNPYMALNIILGSGINILMIILLELSLEEVCMIVVYILSMKKGCMIYTFIVCG